MADLYAILDRILDDMAQIVARISEIERRNDHTMRPGKVTDVDPKKQLARIEIGERDGTPLKSAWVPYAQLAGGYKSHRPPTVGQQMMMFAPNGEGRQALLLPMTWSNDNPAPSDKGDEHVTTYGDMKIVEKADSLSIAMGTNVSIIWNGDKLTLKSPQIVLECGDIRLGGAGAGRPLALQGSIDSAGDTETGNLSTAVKAI